MTKCMFPARQANRIPQHRTKSTPCRVYAGQVRSRASGVAHVRISGLSPPASIFGASDTSSQQGAASVLVRSANQVDPLETRSVFSGRALFTIGV